MAENMSESLACAVGIAAVGTAVLYLAKKRTKKQSKRRSRYWVKPWMKRGDNGGPMFQLYQSIIMADDQEEFRASLRMPKNVYDELLDLVRPFITKKHTNFRRAIPADQRLAITLRYMAFGDSFLDLHQQFMVGKSTVGFIVRETTAAIYEALKDTYLVIPKSHQWEEIASGFEERWNMPHCLGSIDGKHIRIKAPPKSGSFYYNYKEYFSVVLLAIVDHNYEFLYVDVGAEGRASDGGIWSKCSFHEYLHSHENPLEIPHPTAVEGYRGNMPYFFVGDDAFKLSPQLLKPYPLHNLTKKQRIYNYRISRARRIVENAFGIMASKFRIFRKEIELLPKYADNVILAGVVLHNFCRRKCGRNYLPTTAVDSEDQEHRVVPGSWRLEGELESLHPGPSRNASVAAKDVRDKLASYFLTKPGEVNWQYTMALADQ